MPFSYRLGQLNSIGLVFYNFHLHSLYLIKFKIYLSIPLEKHEKGEGIKSGEDYTSPLQPVTLESIMWDWLNRDDLVPMEDDKLQDLVADVSVSNKSPELSKLANILHLPGVIIYLIPINPSNIQYWYEETQA